MCSIGNRVDNGLGEEKYLPVLAGVGGCQESLQKVPGADKLQTTMLPVCGAPHILLVLLKPRDSTMKQEFIFLPL